MWENIRARQLVSDLHCHVSVCMPTSGLFRTKPVPCPMLKIGKFKLGLEFCKQFHNAGLSEAPSVTKGLRRSLGETSAPGPAWMHVVRVKELRRLTRGNQKHEKMSFRPSKEGWRDSILHQLLPSTWASCAVPKGLSTTEVGLPQPATSTLSMGCLVTAGPSLLVRPISASLEPHETSGMKGYSAPGGLCSERSRDLNS